MSLFWKIIGIFMLFWLIWYFTGGPERSTNMQPYLRYDYDSNSINKSQEDLKAGAKAMINLEPETDILNGVSNNLNQGSMTRDYYTN